MSRNNDQDDRDAAESPAKGQAFDRRAAALRANLKRRKAQLRGRAAGQGNPDGASGPSIDDPARPIKTP